MKIIQIATLVTPDGAYGGPIRVAINQTRALLEAGHDVTLAAGARGFGATLPDNFDGVPVRLFDATLIPKLGFAGTVSPGLQKWIKRAAPTADVCHIHLGRDLLTMPAAKAIARAKVPYVVQTHGMIDASSKILSGPFDRFLTRPVLRTAGQVFYLTDQERTDLEGVVPGLLRFAELLNGVPTASSQFGSPEPETPEVLFLARLQARKRPMVFIEMAKRLQGRFPQARFVLVGPDEGEGQAVRDAIADSGLGETIRWEGATEPEQVSERLARCSIYVLPSVNEPFPMSVLEALSLGKPVVVTNTCGLAPFIKTANAGFVAGPDTDSLTEAVFNLLNDKNLREVSGRNAASIARSEFSMSGISEKIIETYDRLVVKNG
ncbi:glycosyltransferase [Arthrobacter sp. FW306-04-A]|uniref:glycosyltransferase n=1 Tax=Arthrobacter sp. FW306-04-A TaxID=2879619 RepID=UPI0037BF1F43|nr:glycosyltransferase [Arthrobacter sp. FW306-04-A]